MTHDYNELRFWLDLAVALGLLANFWWAILDRRHRVTADQLEAHKAATALIQQDHRLLIQRLETRLEAVPDDADVEKIYNRINGIDNRLGGLSEGMEHIDKTLKTILNGLINKGLGNERC